MFVATGASGMGRTCADCARDGLENPISATNTAAVHALQIDSFFIRASIQEDLSIGTPIQILRFGSCVRTSYPYTSSRRNEFVVSVGRVEQFLENFPIQKIICVSSGRCRRVNLPERCRV